MKNMTEKKLFTDIVEIIHDGIDFYVSKARECSDQSRFFIEYVNDFDEPTFFLNFINYGLKCEIAVLKKEYFDFLKKFHKKQIKVKFNFRNNNNELYMLFKQDKEIICEVHELRLTKKDFQETKKTLKI
jgi:hypothetical protein